ncbi:MSHA biogenesis protein MshK [uncultured Vibrio sp.]|uniref:MSHA biogenesis protein MshK n=1 Tax=uncultured Vibrio sp. TaxID=114054 RepID=UPI000914D434|nr:MSHA biogenesis protein MshK [uncultured Vibrio sp.]OIQ24844.1 MAG: MSHA biogenesis protein MshK [Vibrio sp. MedPE-SWchi]
MKVRFIWLCLIAFSWSIHAEQIEKETKDPTAPLGWVKSEESKSTAPKRVVYKVPTLKSIACDQLGRCNAVLNDRVVTKGDKMNGYQVRQISDENVILARGSKLWTLELFSLDIKN